MKTLSEIKNQTTKEKLEILQKFVNESLKEPCEVNEETLGYVFEEAENKADHLEPYAIEDGFKLYYFDMEYCRAWQGWNGTIQYLFVYVALKWVPETEEYEVFFAL